MDNIKNQEEESIIKQFLPDITPTPTTTPQEESIIKQFLPDITPKPSTTAPTSAVSEFLPKVSPEQMGEWQKLQRGITPQMEQERELYQATRPKTEKGQIISTPELLQYFSAPARAVDTIINIPQIGNYMVAELIDSIFDKEDDNIETVFNRLKDALTLKKRTTFLELLNKYKPEWPKWAKTSLGLALDIFADPITYLGGIGLTKLGKNYKSLQSAMRAGFKVDDLSGDLQKTYKALKGLGYSDDAIRKGLSLAEEAQAGMRGLLRLSIPFTDVNVSLVKGTPVYKTADWIGDTILNTWGFKYLSLFSVEPGAGEVKNITSAAYDYNRKNKSMLAQTVQEMLPYKKQIDAYARKQGISVESVYDSIYRYAQRGEPIPQEIKPAADAIIGIGKKLYQLDQAVGNVYAPLENYIFHEINPNVAKAMGWTKPEDAARTLNRLYEFGSVPQSMGHRVFRDLTPHEVNVLWRETDVLDDAFKPIANKKDKYPQLLEENPFIASYTRSIRSIRATNVNELLGEISQYGVRFKDKSEIPEGFMAFSQDYLNSLPEQMRKLVENVAFPAEATKYLQKFITLSQDERAIREAASKLNEITQFFKRNMLASFQWNTRNTFGLAWQLYVNDIDPRKLGQAFYLSTLARKGKAKDFVLKVGNKVYTGDEILQAAKDWGTLDSGVYGGAAVTRLLSGEKSWVEKVTPYADPFFAINSQQENISRLAAYLQFLEKGYAPRDAARSVLHAFGDTRALTDFERTVMANVIPFYGWYKYSIPFQLTKALEQPGKYATINKVWRDIEESRDVPLAYKILLPDWALKSGAIMVGTAEEGGKEQIQYLSREGYDMSFDLVSFLEAMISPFVGEESILESKNLGKELPEPIAWIYEKSHPLIKNVVQAAGLRVDSYGVVYDPDEQVNFLGILMPQKWADILSTIRPLKDLDTLNPGGIFGEEGKPSVFGAPPLGRSTTLSPEQRALKTVTGARLYEVEKEGSAQRKLSQAKSDIGELKSKYTGVILSAQNAAEKAGVNPAVVGRLLASLMDWDETKKKKHDYVLEVALATEKGDINKAQSMAKLVKVYEGKLKRIEEEIRSNIKLLGITGNIMRGYY